ncbi:MAG: RNA polymerase sigma factor [bacterium]|nr:RNA polymerase sigma factor [bacterium]
MASATLLLAASFEAIGFQELQAFGKLLPLQVKPIRISRVWGSVKRQTGTQETKSDMNQHESAQVLRAVEPDEAKLLDRHITGDSAAFPELVSLYRAPVYGYLSRCGVDPDDRDDLFQEIFIKVHRAAASFQPDRPLHPWLFTIVANTVRTYLRRRRVRALIHSDAPSVEPVDPQPDGERTAVARETVTWLEDEIAQLPLVKREVVLLACVEKMPLKSVGEALGLPVNTVKTHLRRARLKLAERLARRSSAEVSS